MKKPYKITCITLGSIIGVLVAFLALYFNTTITVTFDTKGGTIYRSIEIKPNSEVEPPIDPVMAGYEFNGWYEPGATEKFDFSKKITNDITIEARWISVI